MTPRPLALALAAAALAAAAFSACATTEAYVYSARRYDADAGCLARSTAIEQISGVGADATCRPRCMRVGGLLYVSTVCPPLPEIAIPTEPSDPECAAALAVAAFTCGAEAPEDAAEEDGGDGADEPDPEPIEDAGTDAPGANG